MTCWHCDDLDLCSCVTCVKDTPQGQASGPCQACKGRKRRELMRPWLIANNIEPGEARWWVMEGNRRNASAAKRVFLPHRMFDEYMGSLKK